VAVRGGVRVAGAMDGGDRNSYRKRGGALRQQRDAVVSASAAGVTWVRAGSSWTVRHADECAEKRARPHVACGVGGIVVGFPYATR